jgi:redox-sensitive bicupin YhaK (pirin superfamily)
MITLRPAAGRGATRLRWLDSRHTFSFNRYWDPNWTGFRSLRVINDDFIEPGGVFGWHPHENMEILTWVLNGAVEHEDSSGGKGVIRPGDLQWMSAGTGVYHSEANASKTSRLRLLQIWIAPARDGLQPTYAQAHYPSVERANRLRLVADSGGRDGALPIRQDARMFVASLDAGAPAGHELQPGRHAWLQVARGAIVLNGLGLTEGDGAAVSDETRLGIGAVEDSEILLFDLA